VRRELEQVRRILESYYRDMQDFEFILEGDPEGGELLVLGWGSTLGAITGAVNFARQSGRPVSRAHLRYLNPFPRNLGEVLSRFDKVLVPEMNLGQLSLLLRARYLKDIISFTKVQGKPFFRDEIVHKIEEILEA